MTAPYAATLRRTTHGRRWYWLVGDRAGRPIAVSARTYATRRAAHKALADLVYAIVRAGLPLLTRKPTVRRRRDKRRAGASE